MSKARNISNLFSSNTDISTDAELNTHATAANGHTSRGDTASRPGSASQGDTYFNTELGLLEVYDTGRWTTANAVPVAPSSVVATNQPTGRAFNNGQASIAFTAPTTGGRVNTYTVTSSPGSYTNTGSSSPIVLTGLQSSTQYTYSITSTNGVGVSSASESSSGVTATTVPQAPTVGTATEGDSSATLAFTAGSTGGATISNYKYSTDGTTYTAFSPAQTTSPLTISGLTNGQSYSFYLKAVNANGDSIASSASNSVLVGAAGSFESIATVTLSSATSSITFDSIPQTYKHLQLRTKTRETGSTVGGQCQMRVSGDNGLVYTYHTLYAGGSGSPGADGSSNYQWAYGIERHSNGNDPANVFGANIYDFYDYSNTSKKKTIRTYGGYDASGSGQVRVHSALYNSTSAITSLYFENQGGANFAVGTQFALYGIKG